MNSNYALNVPLECPMCGAPDSFLIHQDDPGAGTCWVEKRIWRIQPGPNAPQYPKDGEMLNWVNNRRVEISIKPSTPRAYMIVFDDDGMPERYRGENLKECIYLAMTGQTEDKIFADVEK